MNRYNNYLKRYEKLKKQILLLESEKKERLNKSVFIGGFMFEVSDYQRAIDCFDDQLWMMVIDCVEIHHDGKMIFKFRNGASIEG